MTSTLLTLPLMAASIIAAAADDTAPVSDPPPGMVFVPAGEFVMGSDQGAYDEAPAHHVCVSAFYIDRCEVTNAQFAEFVRATQAYDRVEGPWYHFSIEGCLDINRHYETRYGMGWKEFQSHSADPDADSVARHRDAMRWRSAIAALSARSGVSWDDHSRASLIAADANVAAQIANEANMPVRNVTWRDAEAYARWAGKRLPTEAEWERAARGDDGRIYPWGNTWEANWCHTGRSPTQSRIFAPRSQGARMPVDDPESEAGPAVVGSYPDGASPYGCLDMAGNVWEWTADWYSAHYYSESTGAVDPQGPAGLSDGKLPSPYSDSAFLRTAKQGQEENTRKVLRGGGWSAPPLHAQFNARTTRRLWSNPAYWHSDLGFRCVKEIQP